MKSLLCSLLMVATLGVVFTAQPWWKTAVFYEIYPRSFMDYNNDGIGDLKGITSKIDYLVDLGVTAAWLSPIYKSPMADFGYDVSDYRDIDSIFGTLNDLKELIAALHAKDIKIILDFVPNHSSDEHPWFNKSVNMEGNYTNYYVWRNASAFVNGTPVEPNNWLSVFSGSMWQWNEQRQQFYLHQFLVKQPDLNYRDENLVREMKDILKFWLDLGVDGFRVDAVKYLVEDDRFPDVNISDSMANYGMNPYTQSQNLTYEIVREWGEVLKAWSDADGKDRILFLEIYDTMKVVNSYNGGADLPFVLPFNFMLQLTMQEGTTAKFTEIISRVWISTVPENVTLNWLVGSHDQSRISSKAGIEMVDSYNMILAMMPGIMITYYGEEIGMEDTYLTFEQTRDPSGIRRGREYYRLGSRDPERTPLQWDDTENAGFCKNVSPWLPVNPNYWSLNVAAQEAADRSHLKVYQSLMRLRNTETFKSDTTKYNISAFDDTFVLLRWADVGDKYLLVVNYGNAINSPLDTNFMSYYQLQNITQFTVHTASVSSGYKQGDTIVAPDGLTLRPKAAVVLQVSSNAQSSESSLFISVTILYISLFTFCN